ncbi:ATP-binding protein [Lachnospiraceae bacterium C1.1]|nr:ATP-binding protein [Lachnospiraceae bacterium C1.1]
MDLLELEIDDEDIRIDKVDEAYADQEEFLHDIAAEMDHRLYLYYKYHQWVGPKNDMKNMLGLVITRHEFEHNLSKASEERLEEKCDSEEKAELKLYRDVVENRIGLTDSEAFPAVKLVKRFALDYQERAAVFLSFFAENSDKYRKIIAYLQDDVSKGMPGISLISDLFGDEVDIASMRRKFIERSPFLNLFSKEKLQKGTLGLKNEVLFFLNGSEETRNGFKLIKADKSKKLLIRQDIGRRLDAVFETEGTAVFLSGRDGIGRSFMAEAVAAAHDRDCLLADLTYSRSKPEMIEEADTLSRLFDAVLLIKGTEEKTDGETEAPKREVAEAIEKLEPYRTPLFIISEKVLHLHPALSAISIDLEDTDVDERMILFEHYIKGVELADEVSIEETAVKFHFTPLQIKGACDRLRGIYSIEQRPLTADTVSECCYGEVVTRLERLARKVRGKYTWDDIVIPDEIKRLVRQAIAHVRFHHKVYSEWGFNKKLTYGTGLSVLFAGVPGTGKTMCAQIIAHDLKMEIFKVNLSQIVSKYIGETEKNLQEIFAEAKNSNCILFFDECDSLFGKRTNEVKDANDKNANVESAYLLQQIEEYDGVCILATNLLQNIDEAFLRRITFIVHFPFPDADARKEIYRRTFPAGMELSDDIDWDFISRTFELSGGYIKNIVLSAAFLAAEEGSIVSMKHMVNAAVDEMKKNGIVVVRELLQEYADLLE